jgi:hypothetical protein
MATDTSIGSWFYNDSHIDYRTAGVNVIQELIDIVSKNGNLLLNVPQRPDGSVDPGARNMSSEKPYSRQLSTLPVKQTGSFVRVCGRVSKHNVISPGNSLWFTDVHRLQAI